MSMVMYSNNGGKWNLNDLCFVSVMKDTPSSFSDNMTLDADRGSKNIQYHIIFDRMSHL